MARKCKNRGVVLKEPENPMFRSELKHYINMGDYEIIKSRLSAVAKQDRNAGEKGKYIIRSLYFDNIYDKAMLEKQYGLMSREKFRIRYYNGDVSYIRLEKKTKVNGAGYKVSARLTADECQSILKGDTEWMQCSGDALVTEFYAKMKYQRLKPKTIVDYDREPFIYDPGNVRVTLDSNLKTGIRCVDFLDSKVPTVKVSGQQFAILEVKYDEFLPEIIRKAVQLPGRQASSFSKYVACRIFG